MTQPRTIDFARPVEVWGGVECTVNRVGDVYFDQLERNGHARRATDLDLFASLGLRTLRYPILWERLAPSVTGEIDWSWPDERLHRLRTLGIRVIAGLTHHGSGPFHTSLVDRSFAEELSIYAGRIASRYPWIDAYTPVNEPLTTARFSGLYGLWHPHGRDDSTFARALVSQCRAITAAMMSIRAVNPSAQLVQTEDLGRTYGTPAMAAVTTFYNERRWLSLDLLCGRVGPAHPMHGRLLQWGVAEAELDWQVTHACPPDIIGVNHYLTSDRYLDETVDRYPLHTRGATPDGVPYADVEAVRASLACDVDPSGVLKEAWARYRIPVALTEVHLGSTRDEQMRWLQQCWLSAAAARDSGVDVRAVTVWSLLGSFDWNVLVTAEGHCYEPGPFDVRGATPRATAVAHLVRDLASGRRRHADPILDSPGWWRRADRLYGVSPPCSPRTGECREEQGDRRQARAPVMLTKPAGRQPVAIVGSESILGQAFVRACEARGLAHRVVSHTDLDSRHGSVIENMMAGWRPWAVIHAMEDAAVDGPAGRSSEYVPRDTLSPASLARASAPQGVHLAWVSSDAVFDGACDGEPFIETDPVCPVSIQGHYTADMETRVAQACPDTLIVRTGELFGALHGRDVVTRILAGLWRDEPQVVAGEHRRTLTYIPHLVDAVLDLLIDRERGVWHLVNGGSVSDERLVRRLAELSGRSPAAIRRLRPERFEPAPRRPRRPALSSARGMVLPRLDDALGRFVADQEPNMASVCRDAVSCVP